VASVFGQLARWPELFEALWGHFARPEHWRLYDDVAPALAQLHRVGIACGIASNFDSRLFAIRAGFAPLATLEWVFAAAELGWRKPALEFFSTISARIGLPPGRIWMVGDDWGRDVVPALAAGWQAILLNRAGDSSLDIRAEGFLQIRSLSEIAANVSA
jgi:putative hydrolase of the HAD superfamily